VTLLALFATQAVQVPVKFVITPEMGVPNAGATRVLLDRVAVSEIVSTVSLVDGNVIVVPSVPAKVSELLIVSVLPEATLSPVTEVAAIVPVPDTLKLPPVPITKTLAFVAADTPEKGTAVAVIVPEPVAPRLPPVPTKSAAVLVPAVIAENAGAPADAEITPPEIVMDVPSGFTHPNVDVVAVGQELPNGLISKVCA
jgi:hypothetical protein